MISKLLEQHYYDGKIGVMLVTQNKTITTTQKSQSSIYAKYQLMPLRNRMGTLNSIEQSGILQITLFVDTAIGTDLIDAKAQAIVEHFGTEKAHTVNGKRFMVMSSTANAAMPDGEGKYMCPISIEYRII